MEKTFKPVSGYIMLLVTFIVLLFGIYSVAVLENPWFISASAMVFVLLIIGFLIVYPNNSCAVTLFGKYAGTIKENGFHWVNPFFMRKKVSLRAQNFDSDKIKVNDKLGNPIQISVILVWQVNNTYKAVFEVNDYEAFVRVQTDSAVRKLAGLYPYDNFDDEEVEITLRSGLHEVNHALEKEVSERLVIAGIKVIEARIGFLAYASEIANSMLRRQQATAILAARRKIVQGAVGMVEMALEELSKKKVVNLDENRKATMVSNLMVVLCSDKDASPVVNTGTLYQ